MTGRFKSSSKRKRNAKHRQDPQKVIESVDRLDEPHSPEAFLSHKKVRWDGDGDREEIWSDQEDHRRPDKVYLTAWCLNGRIGCAYFDPVRCLIYVLEDTQETSHFDVTRMVLEHVQPDVILTSSRADDKFIDIIRTHSEESGSIFQIRPHKDFTTAKGRNRLLSLRLLSELVLTETDIHSSSNYDMREHREIVHGDPTMKRQNAALRLSNFASVESSPLCIASVGSLIDHLVRERTMGDVEDEGIAELEVRNIEMFTLEGSLQVNADTLSDESHASVHSDKTKEGLSLFGTLNYTKTVLGRSLLRTWLLRPTLSVPVINARHDAVECFLRPENLATAEIMHDHLKGIRNMPRTLSVMKGDKAKVSDWQALVKFTVHSSLLRDALNDLHHAGCVEIVLKLIAGLEIAKFKEIGNTINETIDWEESITANRVCIRPHIDRELDDRKSIYHGIDSVLSKVAEQICETVPTNFASSLNVVYFPQLGFLVCVPMLEEWTGAEGIKIVDGWAFQFASESHVYFKSQEMHDMDTHIGDLHSSIIDREIEIVQQLLERIMVFREAIESACDICAELDCLLSFAEASRVYDYRRPRMVEDNIIEIMGGRHPLYEQVLDTFVPNDAYVVGGAGIGCGHQDGRSSVVLITGANACGKSVYLTQIAMIQYMAQIGCFVPAESAVLGVVDKILTRISTRESVAKVQSAFMIDLSQVSLALRNSTPHSLILLDEFGKGTQPSDGAGLFCGVLKHLLSRGRKCPKVLATTHFHDVFSPDLLDPESLPITFLHMEVMFMTSNGEPLDQNHNVIHSSESKDTMTSISAGNVTYLYKIASGLSLYSHAAQCAGLFRIPQRAVSRAQYVSKLLATHEIGQLLDEKMTEEDILDLENAEAVCRNFLTWDLQSEGDDDARGLSAIAKLRDILGRTSD